MARFSETSLEQLSTCDQRLEDLLRIVVRNYDCKILQGHRSPEEQAVLFASGKSKVRVSKHNAFPSEAVDVSPWPIPDKWGDGNSLERAKFYHFAGYMKAMAENLGFRLRWGGDWDGDLDFDDQTFMDLVHFEIKE